MHLIGGAFDQGQKLHCQWLAGFAGKKVGYAGVATAQDALGVVHRQALDGLAQQVCRQGHGLLGGLVHGGHQFVQPFALTHGFEHGGRVVQHARQPNAHLGVA